MQFGKRHSSKDNNGSKQDAVALTVTHKFLFGGQHIHHSHSQSFKQSQWPLASDKIKEMQAMQRITIHAVFQPIHRT